MPNNNINKKIYSDISYFIPIVNNGIFKYLQDIFHNLQKYLQHLPHHE